jgi:DNA invertase Pin-like site-specific DNA recombinase
MKPAVGYLRVSTTDQETEQQRTAILRAAEAKGYAIESWYEEKISGRTTKRPELRRLQVDAKAGKVTAVFVWSLDRLSRAGILDSLLLLKELEGYRCDVISLQDPLPEPGALHRDLVLSVLFWVAEYESRRRSERVKAGMDRAKRLGTRSGKPIGRVRWREVDVARLAALRAEGRSWPECSVALGIPARTLRDRWAAAGGEAK